MRYPDFLVQGGTVGFVAPSFGCATEPYITGFKKAQEEQKKKGLNCMQSLNKNGQERYESNHFLHGLCPDKYRTTAV